MLYGNWQAARCWADPFPYQQRSLLTKNWPHYANPAAQQLLAQWFTQATQRKVALIQGYVNIAHGAIEAGGGFTDSEVTR